MNEKQEIQNWWASNPQTYGDLHGRTDYLGQNFELSSRAFFERLDREFYSWHPRLHQEHPFDRLFPYHEYPAGSRVLEIGCGLGTMAMNWALKGVELTAVDLNPTAIEQTTARFDLYGLSADIRLADANQLPFENNEFDYAYSWGVLHHSPNLEQSIAEMMRVTRPGGGFGLMLYNRHSLYQWYSRDYLEGYLHFENHFLGPLELSSRYTDGDREEGNPHTWPVTKKEMLQIIRPFSRDVQVKILGTDLDNLFKLLLPGLGLFLPAWSKKVWARRFGWSLWIHGHKAS
jgi:SAM-dependent methyltransferase